MQAMPKDDLTEAGKINFGVSIEITSACAWEPKWAPTGWLSFMNLRAPGWNGSDKTIPSIK